LNERQEAMVIRRSTVVTCAAALISNSCAKDIQNALAKLVFLPNGFDPTDFLEVEPICPSDAAFNLLHAGHISGWRRALLSPLFEALTKLPTDIRMWFIGETKSAEVEDQIGVSGSRRGSQRRPDYRIRRQWVGVEAPIF